MLISEQNNLYYFGVRSSRCNPNNDTDYMSSSELVRQMILCGIGFRKEIVETFPNRESAEQHEQWLFDQYQAVEDIQCINLNSYNNPYRPGRAQHKISHYQQLFPQLKPGYFVDQHRVLSKEDLQYQVGPNRIFIGHPERIKFYYPTTGTVTYWPGRPDRLMTRHRRYNKYYVTDFDNIQLDGTPVEQIRYLMRDHYQSGQRIPIVEWCEQIMASIPDRISRYELIEEIRQQVDPDCEFILSRMKSAARTAQRPAGPLLPKKKRVSQNP